MNEKRLKLQPDLPGKERRSFATIEERARYYRSYYRPDLCQGKTGEDKRDSARKANGTGEESEPQKGGEASAYDGGHYTENRVMEGNFATLLCLYDRSGGLCSVSRQGVRLTHNDLPGQGTYHRHQYIEVFYVIEGCFEQILLGERRRFSKGEVVITDQNCEHADYLEREDGAVLFLWLLPDFLDGLLKSYEGRDDLQQFLFHALERQKREQSFLELKAEKGAEGIGALLERLVAEDYGRLPGFREIIRGNLIRLFHLLCTSYALQLYSSDQESKERVLLYELERYIRLHAAQVTAAGLEEHFHYHRNYYNLLLRKYKGKSFREYVQEIRIGRARELLTGTELPLKQIAAQVGYENTSFFYHLFERVTGTAPGELRRGGGG